MKKTMKALMLRSIAKKQFQIEDIPIPALGKGEALVRLLAASLNRRDQ
jgi:NADPH:quinone reductase-like Zn-dependent oxidoreductase